ncbi:uncharacterized protein FTOL_13784 [Fusarium torulosum]|uniref:Uncharacterized protein n=1 Tax=Fusarium torulosum TaxID=33205 RepID=A0AAE8MPN5_9HYPO|nr:uncharacterized protein FTOL_13784 [Fusarium torulosum]
MEKKFSDPFPSACDDSYLLAVPAGNLGDAGTNVNAQAAIKQGYTGLRAASEGGGRSFPTLSS